MHLRKLYAEVHQLLVRAALAEDGTSHHRMGRAIAECYSLSNSKKFQVAARETLGWLFTPLSWRVGTAS